MNSVVAWAIRLGCLAEGWRSVSSAVIWYPVIHPAQSCGISAFGSPWYLQMLNRKTEGPLRGSRI